MAKKLALDELPKRLLKNDATVEDLLMVYGFVGEGTEEDNITFYLDPALKTSFIVKDEDIVHHVKVTKSQNPIGGTVIWIKNAASYTQGNQAQNQAQTQQNAAQFFQGDIYQQYANTVQGNTVPKPQGVRIPVCGCGKCGQ
ncbi:hypothetical protein [Kordia sp.]|uniref:hypothetical protein n=1 Tax=Kordia sp. TaxID=1965332 RepID=UPI0025BA6420|nr:hypothetical protein [Kordia sp.]MCH2195316.1 hypothetical protein [Kordia sp.]